jgi:MoaA/NifB/PqqE/SkfB family radical SAM enzyme
VITLKDGARVVLRGSHGWNETNSERKREIIRGIASGRATRGPVHAELDLTDRCNVACYFCNQQDVRTKDQISIEHLRRLIDELAQGGLRSVRLSGGGDPLAHRQAADVLDHLATRGIVVDNLTTNGALLTEDIARKLVDGRAREVIFSLNAVDANDYARMMQVRPAVFDRVIEAIRRLVAIRGESIYPSVVVQFLLDRRNFHEMPRMEALGVSLGADRIAMGVVLDIPRERIDAEILLVESDGEAVRPYLEEILRRDRGRGLLQLNFPISAWNAMLAEIKAQLDYPPEENLFPTATSFREENGHCFFGWYTATIRGNGDLYPCCLLMTPDYKPLGNALQGSFRSHWNGPQFRRLRSEMREVMLDGESARFDPERHRVIRPQCVGYGMCWLKNMYFRGDEAFYAELAVAMEKARRRAALSRLARQGWRFARRVPPGLRRRAKSLFSRLAGSAQVPPASPG